MSWAGSAPSRSVNRTGNPAAGKPPRLRSQRNESDVKQHHLIIRRGDKILLNMMCETASEAVIRVVNHLLAMNRDWAFAPFPHFVFPAPALLARAAMKEAILGTVNTSGREHHCLAPLDDLLAAQGLTVSIDVVEGKPAPAIHRVHHPLTLSTAARPAEKHHHLMVAQGSEILLNRLYTSRRGLAEGLIHCLLHEEPETGIEPGDVQVAMREALADAAGADYPEGESFGSMKPEDYLDVLGDLLSAAGITLYTDTLELPAAQTR